jgi:3-hydroxyacyl-CoA dehydrogenase
MKVFNERRQLFFVGNCDGFCGNRLLRPYLLEMVSVLVEGAASIAQIDAAVRDPAMVGVVSSASASGIASSYNSPIPTSR